MPAFKPVEWKHARQTLVVLGLLLATMFLGISWLAAKLQVAPDFTGRSTVVADIGKAVYGTSPLGHAAFALLQIATTLILVLAANTAYADFPRLANFHAGRRLPAAAVHDARAPARVLERDPRAVGGRDRCW